MREIYKDIIGYENIYQISNLGNVKVLERSWRCGNNYNVIKHHKEYILKTKITSKGYAAVKLCKDGKRSWPLVHRLIAQAFISNPNNLPDVNHRNGIKKDNSISNLEWITNLDNIKHASLNGLLPRGESMYCSKITESQALRIKYIYNYMKPKKGYWSSVEKNLGISRTSLENIKYGKNWKHITI